MEEGPLLFGSRKIETTHEGLGFHFLWKRGFGNQKKRSISRRNE